MSIWKMVEEIKGFKVADPSMVKESYELLFEKQLPYKAVLRYINNFSPYGGNIRMNFSTIEVRLSKRWKNVSREIQMGIIQELMTKLFKKPRRTMHIDLYNNFVKNLHIAIPKTKIDPLLKESFDRVNDKHFSGMIEMPNLVFGRFSTHKMGSYDYKKDTISISRILIEDPELLDYVMYHEILHKKHKFHRWNGKNVYHNSTFRRDERAYPGHEEMESRLNRHIRKNMWKRAFFGNRG
ncbi:M48 family metallopeptidase [Candidatus Woesearchaeota archaeon]|nr:M48 family metallopeptidase [Candidatus Woesearchaeota archaeon]